MILATDPPQGLSLHNVLAGTVTALSSEGELDVVVVQMAIGESRVLVEVTRDAISRLQVAPGVRLDALIKSVSLEVRAVSGVTAIESPA